MRTPKVRWSVEEDGMAELDDIVGTVMKYLKDSGLDDNTIVAFTTDNGAENFTWPDGGQTPFAGGKGTALEGGFRVPAILRRHAEADRKSTRLNSSHPSISYAVFCLKKKINRTTAAEAL